MALTAWDQFTNQLAIAKGLWNSNQNRNFGSAYDRALTTYAKTLKDQQDADQKAAEARATLIMLAFSLAGGSALSTLFGEAALKTVAGKLVQEAALNTVVKYGWERAFDALAWTTSNKTALFVIGTVWDGAQDQAKQKVTEALKAIPASATVSPSDSDQNPSSLEFQNSLLNYTDKCEIALRTYGETLASRPNSGAALAALASSSPFFKAPKQALNVDTAAARMELSFWMKYVLGRDAFQEGHYQEVYGAMHGVKAVVDKTTPITTSPLSQNFPAAYKSDGYSFSKVTYQPVGDVVKKRIDTVYGTVFPSQSFFGPGDYDNESNLTVRAAEVTLRQLAMKNAATVKASIQ